MPTEWREGKEKFKRGHIGDDQLLRGTQKCDIFFKGTQVKASEREERGRVEPQEFLVHNATTRASLDGEIFYKMSL